MGQHCAKGRYLDPENFSKELVLNFNSIWQSFSILNFEIGIVSDFLQLLKLRVSENATISWRNLRSRFDNTKGSTLIMLACSRLILNVNMFT